MTDSEVRRILAQIDAEYEAAKRGLSGLAEGTTYHQFIAARSERIAALHKELVNVLGDQDSATMLVIEHQARLYS